MPTMTTRERMDTIPYDRFRAEYLAEIREGTKAMRLPEFKTILERMTDYPAYAESRTGISDPLAPIVKESKRFLCHRLDQTGARIPPRYLYGTNGRRLRTR